MLEVLAPESPTDFWGVVFPAYLGAVGAIVSSGVAAWALIREIGTRKGLTEIAREANKSDLGDPHSAVVAMGQAAQEAAEWRDTQDEPVHPLRTTSTYRRQTPASPWEIRTLRRGHYILRNATDHPVTLLEMASESPANITTLFSWPLTVHPGEGYEFRVHHVLGGPAIITVVFTYELPNGEVATWQQFL
ncbi:hypothetical protein [Agromyces sp. NPDC058126]|uniref:hypothetical protein n=1 Tax=Agromyces sp. NPDC058126 TaxID=3346350 RepID=UPI0036D8882B